VYYSDERFGIRKYAADPAVPNASAELAAFGKDGYAGDREGLAIYRTGPATGYLLSSDQVAGKTRVIVYAREGDAGRPHNHPRLAVVPTASDSTDGLDVVSSPVPGFPHGMLVMMTSGPRTFLMYDWDAVADRIRRTLVR
jgi:3-phytase